MDADNAEDAVTSAPNAADRFETLGRQAGAALRGGAGVDVLDQITKRGQQRRTNRVAALGTGAVVVATLAVGVIWRSTSEEQRNVATTPTTTTVPATTSDAPTTTQLPAPTTDRVDPTTPPPVDLEPVTIERAAAAPISDADRNSRAGAIGPTAMLRLIGDPVGYGHLRQVGFASDGSTVFVDMWAKRVQFDPISLEPRPNARVETTPGVATTGEVISPRGDRALTATSVIDLVDPRDGSVVRTLDLDHVTLLDRWADFSPDGTRLAIVSSPAIGQSAVTMFDASTGEQLYDVETDDQQIFSVRFAPDGLTFATDGNARGRLWDTANGAPVLTVGQTPEQGGIPQTFVEFSPDGTTLLVTSDGGAEVIDLPGGKVRFRVESLSIPRFIAGGSRVLVGAIGESTWDVRVYDSVTGDLVARLDPPAAPLAGATWDAVEGDDRVFLAPAETGTVGVWDLRTGTRLSSLVGHPGAHIVAGVSPDGRTIVTADELGYVALWPMPEPQLEN